VKRALPLAPYLQKTVVVDRFEPDLSTWFSKNARKIEIAPGGPSGLALHVRYPRGRHVESQVRRALDMLQPMKVHAVRFRMKATEPTADPVVILKSPAGAEHTSKSLTQRPVEGTGFAEGTATFDPAVEAPAELIIRDVTSPDTPGLTFARENTLVIDDVALLGADARALWSEDFDGHGWSAAGQPLAGVIRLPAKGGALGLRIEPDAAVLSRNLEAYALAGRPRLRFKLWADEVPGAAVGIALVDPDGRRRETSRRLKQPGWNRLDLPLAGFERAGTDPPGRPVRLELALPADSGVRAIRELEFYRRPQLKYELAKLMHCAVPSAAGLIVFLAMVWALKMRELRAVTEWVRRRGWKKRGIEKAEAEDSGLE
jgi:hypothetical protein